MLPGPVVLFLPLHAITHLPQLVESRLWLPPPLTHTHTHPKNKRSQCGVRGGGPEWDLNLREVTCKLPFLCHQWTARPQRGFRCWDARSYEWIQCLSEGSVGNMEALGRRWTLVIVAPHQAHFWQGAQVRNPNDH
ncbi:hypothetical protein QBC35DRAFT_469255 [Podospora australis]|uniref:Uncharacterized protein n=1 Tax=Podospora australis TaxID=1536484 RepID=A0AAN6X4V0_9PEZI|nr:hypothetical protein QBC35DRAFT_469255 [Podospora australis]